MEMVQGENSQDQEENLLFFLIPCKFSFRIPNDNFAYAISLLHCDIYINTNPNGLIYVFKPIQHCFNKTPLEGH